MAFSGGVDSSVVAAAAKEALGGESVYAVTAESPTFPGGELEEAKRLASLLKVRHVIVETRELENPLFVANDLNRCYYCKKELAAALKQVASSVGADVIVDGSNADDVGDHRPGMRALHEEGVRSPLLELGVGKAEVRRIAARLGLPNADKPPMACLATRIPFGQEITAERLRRIAAAEAYVKKTLRVRQLRVRDHGDLARIEVGGDERGSFFDVKIMDDVAEKLRELGFKYVTLDLLGYGQGPLSPSERDRKLKRTANN